MMHPDRRSLALMWSHGITIAKEGSLSLPAITVWLPGRGFYRRNQPSPTHFGCPIGTFFPRAISSEEMVTAWSRRGFRV